MTAATDQLFWACLERDVQHVAQALARDAQVNDRDHENNTPLLALLRQGPGTPEARNDQREIFALLIQAGAQLQKQDAKGFSGFHWLQHHDHTDLAGDWLKHKGQRGVDLLTRQMNREKLSGEWWNRVRSYQAGQSLETALGGKAGAVARARL